LAVRDADVKATLHTFVPVLLGRGSVQLSGYIDQVIASYLGQGMVAALANAQTLYLLPVSLFGMAVSAAELPEMSGVAGDQAARAEHMRERLRGALRRVVFLVVPSAVAFVTVGDSIVSLLFQSGRFGAHATNTVWVILIGSALGLASGTQGRLLASAFYALGDPRPPLRAALLRVAITGLGGFALALPVRAWLGYSATWGAFGLTASAGVAAWIEFMLLRHTLAARIGGVPTPVRLGLGALAVALFAGASGHAASGAAQRLGAPAWLASASAVVVFGAVYLGVMTAARVPEARDLLRRVLRRKTNTSVRKSA
jgi:putative peptidoglycan lipid II flippase